MQGSLRHLVDWWEALQEGLVQLQACNAGHAPPYVTQQACRLRCATKPSCSPLFTLPCPQAVGRTRHNKLCYFPGDGERLKGQLVHVHVDRVHAYTLYGRMLD